MPPNAASPASPADCSGSSWSRSRRRHAPCRAATGARSSRPPCTTPRARNRRSGSHESPFRTRPPRPDTCCRRHTPPRCSTAHHRRARTWGTSSGMSRSPGSRATTGRRCSRRKPARTGGGASFRCRLAPAARAARQHLMACRPAGSRPPCRSWVAPSPALPSAGSCRAPPPHPARAR